MFKKTLFILIITVLLLTACQYPFAAGKSTPISSETPAPEGTPTPALRILTVCLGEEPNTLYPYAGLNEAALSVMAAIDDGPIDTLSYNYQPVILQKLPSQADGDVQIVPVSVTAGKAIVDADGNLTALRAGTHLRPASCRTDGCVITYDGFTPLKMDQMSVTFKLRTDLTWSDGTPLTADDSVYAFQLAADKSTPGSKFLVNRTQTYEAADPATIEWWGIPGYFDPSYVTNFWTPAPKHIWSQFKAIELPQIDVAERAPIGWGPYMMQEWIAGDHITLAKNPYYFRIAQGYPKFDELVFRFISDPNAAISELAAGRCDILDPSVHLDTQIALLQQMQQSKEVRTTFAQGQAIEWLALGIRPSSYDDGYNTAKGDRQDSLADPRTRQAIAFCLDRQKAAETILYGESSVPLSFVPTDHPLYSAGVPSYKFDPAAGIQLLEQTGWKDLDGNTATPRQAVSVKNVAAGTPLMLNYYLTSTLQHRQTAEILTQSLAQCGIGVNVQYYDQNELYTPGPAGLLFGRHFDLAEFGLATDSIEPPCDWFTTAEIPNAVNNWVGTNVTGYQNAEYDAACHNAGLALPDEQSYKDGYHQVQAIFAADLPAIPLYYRLKVAASQADICHFDLDPTANPLWNVEAFDKGQACK